MFHVPSRFPRCMAGASLVVLAAVVFGAAVAQGKEGRHAPKDGVTAEIPWSPRHSYEDVIVELPPLRPWKKGAAAAAKTTPAVTARPADTEAAPALARAEAAPQPAQPLEAKIVPEAKPAPRLEAAPAEAPAKVQAAAQQAAPATPAPAPAEAAKDAAPAEPATAPTPAEPVPAPAAKSADVAAASQPEAKQPAETKQVEAEQAEAAPIDAKPAETAPVDPKAVEAKAIDANAAEAKPVDANAANAAEAAKTAEAAGGEPAEPPPARAAAAPEAAGPAVEKKPAAAAPASESPDTRIAALLASGVKGPAEVRLADRATMWLPAGRIFLPAEAAGNLAGELGQPRLDAAQGVIAPAGAGRPEWLAYIELLDDGFVKDADAGSLDPAKLLETYKARFAGANAARVQNGRPAFDILGWARAPRYDEKNRLSACIGAAIQASREPQDRFYNCQAFALGRQGALKVTVASAEEGFAKLEGEAALLAQTIVYDKGMAYGDIDPSADKAAPYGPGDLLTGEAAVASLGAATFAGGAARLDLLDRLAAVVVDNGELIAIALVGLLLIARRYGGGKAAAEPAPAKAEAVKAAGNASPAPGRVAGLSAKLAALRNRRNVGDAPKSAPSARASRDAKPAPVAAEKAEAAPPAGGGLFAGLAARVKSAAVKKTDKAARATAASKNGPPAPEAGGEAPGSILGRLAARMRKQAPEAPASGPDLARATRVRASTPAPARDGAERRAREADAATQAETPAAASEALDSLALVEPGDQAATTAAISARRALRDARA